MIYGSICSGIEAATAAWHPLGWRAAFFSEIEAFPRAVLQHHYPQVPLHGDFTTIQGNEYAAIDALVGGTPCQSFSVAGLRQGFADQRGNLTLEFVRLAQRLRPRWLVWENVPGVLSIDGGRAFGSFLGGLAECGYGFAYRILDAQYFGVPQRRRRVFVVGYLGDWRPPAAVLFERESLRRDITPSREARKGIANSVAYGIDPDCFDRDGEGAGGTAGERSGLGIDTELAYALRAKRPGGVAFGGNNQSGPIDVATAVNAHGGPHGAGFRTDGMAHTLEARNVPQATSYRTNAAGQVDAQGECAAALTTMTDPSTQFIAFAHFQDSQFGCKEFDTAAIRAGRIPEHSMVLNQTMTVRRLTPRECERLQGFAYDYTLVPFRGRPAADGNRYKALGNSMAVPVMRWIGERIEFISQIQTSGNGI